MGDVLVKAREDKKKAREAAELRKEAQLKAAEGGHSHHDTEMTPLYHGPNSSYVDPEHDVHENQYVHFAAKMFDVGTISEEHHHQKKKRSDFPVNQRLSYKDYEESVDECLWTSMPDSIVALNLTLACTKDLTDDTFTYIKAALFCGLLPLVMTFVIEFTGIMCLWEDNSDLRNSDAFCHQHPLLQLSVVTLFGLTLQGPLLDILTEAAIGLSSTKVCFCAEDGAKLFLEGAGAHPGKGREFVELDDRPLIIKEVKTSFVSWFVFWTAIILEFAVWSLTVYVGVHYTLSQEDASEIVQSAVAISFINEIDNMVYDAVATEPVKEFLAKAEYMIPLMKASGKRNLTSAVLRLSMQAPILCTVVYFVVFTLRNTHCDPVTGEPLRNTFEESD